MMHLIMQAKLFFSQFRTRGEKGQGLVEYALIIVLISIVAIVAMGLVGTDINLVFTRLAATLTP